MIYNIIIEFAEGLFLGLSIMCMIKYLINK